MKGFLITMMAVVLTLLLFSSSATADWDKVFGGADYECAYSVQQTREGGYIVVGETKSYGDAEGFGDVWLIKTDADGNKEWDRTFGGRREDVGRCVQQTSDGGYIITGWTESFGASTFDVWLIKTDSNGNKEWDRLFSRGGRWDLGSDYGYSVAQTSDGGYIIAGESYMEGQDGVHTHDVWVIKTDSQGNMEWNKTFGGEEDDGGRCVRQTSDGGYIVVGYTRSLLGPAFWGNDIYLIKIDPQGSLAWSRKYDNTRYDYGYSVQQTSDGGYIVVGESFYDVWLIKTGSGGGLQWERFFRGETGWNNNKGYSVWQTREGGYIWAGYTGEYGGYGQAWVVRTDKNGETLWGEKLGGGHDEIAYSVQQTTDDGYIVAGLTGTYGADTANVWLVKLDPRCKTFYLDSDDDCYGVSENSRCLVSPSYPFSATVGGDCDDWDPEVKPGMPEVVCNGKDDDCNPATPDDTNADGDPASICGGDCDDDDPARYPGNPEVCDDGIDNDCDFLVDGDDPDCSGMTDITYLHPPNEASLSSFPTFTLTAASGLDNRFAVDLSDGWTFSRYWSPFEPLHQAIAAESQAMPQSLWNMIPSGSYVCRRVYGADLLSNPPVIVAGKEVW